MKYIIDIPDKEETMWEGFNGDLFIPITMNKGTRTWVNTDLKITPYTEPDPNPLVDEAVETIENEVWEFVRIITDMTECERKECFGGSTCDLDEYMTYQEAKAKYEAWKKSKDEIRVGDEVTLSTNEKLVVVTIDGTSAQGIDENGECYESIFLNELKKTGRHFNEVEELMKKMRSSDD